MLENDLLQGYSINNRISAYLVESVAPEAWAAKPPDGKGRTIAALAAHMHNVRLMWLKAAGGGAMPDKLDDACTPTEAVAALQASHDAMLPVLNAGLASGKIKGFKPNAAAFLCYLIAHDAHHRGQMTALARRLGHPVSQKAMFGIWEWGTRASEVSSRATEAGR